MTESIRGVQVKARVGVVGVGIKLKYISLFATTIFLEQCAVLRLSSRKTINSKSGHLESKFSPCLPPCANNMAKTDRGEIKCDQSQHHSNHEISLLFMGEFFTMDA